MAPRPILVGMSPVNNPRIICRRPEAGQTQSAFLAGLLAIILAIVAVIVVLAPVIGGAATDYWLCQLFSQNPATCVAPADDTALPDVIPGDIPKPEEDCIVIPGPYSQPPICTTEDGEVVMDFDLGDAPAELVEEQVEAVNEAGSLGNYFDQVQNEFPLEGIPPIPTDLEGHVEINDDGTVSIIVPNDEVHEESWWISGWVAMGVGIALGWIAEAACEAAMVPATGPTPISLIVCGAIRGFVTAFMGNMLYNLMEGSDMSDPAVWGRSLAMGLVGAIGVGAWEAGVNKFMRVTLAGWFRGAGNWVGEQLKRFGSWLGDGVTAIIDSSKRFLTGLADGWSEWWDEALSSTPRPPGAGGNAAARPGGTEGTAGGEPLLLAYLRDDGALPSQTRIASERERTPSLV